MNKMLMFVSLTLILLSTVLVGARPPLFKPTCDPLTTSAIQMAVDNDTMTASTMMGEYPMGSVMIYSLDEQGVPFVFICELSEHTQNIEKNPKASLMIVKEDADNKFNASRLTFVGTLKKVPEEKRKAYEKIYSKHGEDATMLFDFADFHFYRMEVEKIYHIDGFGKIGWLDVDNYKACYLYREIKRNDGKQEEK